MSYLEMAKAFQARRLAGPHRPEEASPLEAPATPFRDLVAEYQHVLGRLWIFNIPPSRGLDAAETRGLLAQQAKLCDELGPEFAAAVSRHHARAWARAMKRCPWCGTAGVFHDPDTDQEIVL